MIMLDYPASDCPSIRGQWAAFEDMLAKNGTLSIAVSNFSPDQLDCIVSNKVRPHALTRSPARACPLPMVGYRRPATSRLTHLLHVRTCRVPRRPR